MSSLQLSKIVDPREFFEEIQRIALRYDDDFIARRLHDAIEAYLAPARALKAQQPGAMSPQ